MIVYRIVNKVNGKSYVGQTRKPMALRFKQHCKPASKQVIGKAIQKYGKDNFTVGILANCSSVEEMNDIEQYYIGFLNTMLPSGYNGDSGGNAKKEVSADSKAKQSAKMKGRHSSPSTQFKPGPRPDIRGAKNPMFGKPGPKRKQVICIETNEVFSCVKDVAQKLGVNRSYLSRILNGTGRGSRAKGLSFKFLGAA